MKDNSQQRGLTRREGRLAPPRRCAGRFFRPGARGYGRRVFFMGQVPWRLATSVRGIWPRQAPVPEGVSPASMAVA